jgi:hypothetical protein
MMRAHSNTLNTRGRLDLAASRALGRYVRNLVEKKAPGYGDVIEMAAAALAERAVRAIGIPKRPLSKSELDALYGAIVKAQLKGRAA